MPTHGNPNDPGAGPKIMGILWSLTLIAVSVVSARLYVRKKIGALSWDDWLMLFALVFQLVDMSFITKAVSLGFGKHDGDLMLDQLEEALNAIFLLRLFGVRPWFKWYLVISAFLQCLSGIVVLLVQFLGVSPVEALWNPTIKATRIDPHIAQDTAYVGQAIFTIGDITYVLFPVIIIWRLNMSLGRRLALILLMCTSLITAAASIMKAKSSATISAETTQPQYYASLAALWSGIEQTLVIIMASVPTLRAISKIDFSVFSRLSSSLASRFSRSESKKSSEASSESTKSGYYGDVEQSPARTGHLFTDMSNKGVGSLSKITTMTHSRNESTQNLTIQEPAASIWQINEFSVSYNDKS